MAGATARETLPIGGVRDTVLTEKARSPDAGLVVWVLLTAIGWRDGHEIAGGLYAT